MASDIDLAVLPMGRVPEDKVLREGQPWDG